MEAMVDWSQSSANCQQSTAQPSSPTAHNLEIAAKAYLENNVRYYLQNSVNNTGTESKTSSSANRNAAKDFIVRATKLSKTSAASNTTSNRSTAPLFSQIVSSLAPMPTLSSNTTSHSTTTSIKNQTIISNRFPRQEHPLGKVKVILQISHSQPLPTSYLKVDSSRKHLTLYDPTLLSSYEQNQRPTAPKMFAFDAIVNTNANGNNNCNNNSLELSKSALPELIDAVMNGNDSVLFALGKTGTRETMLATDGLMVYAINWLFSALKASKRRFAIKCSAAQISHNSISDVLAQHHSSSSTSLSSPICSTPHTPHTQNTKLLKTNTILSELREMSCISAKRAAHCLDISANYNQTQPQSDQNSLLFTLHVYQYKIISTTNGKNTVVGGRSKLHLFDLSPSIKNLTNVLLAIFNGQKHIPNKDSKLTAVLKECLSSRLVWTSIVANITNCESNYLDTVTTCQFVTRIHRSRIIYNGRHKIRRLTQHHFPNNFNDCNRSEGIESMNASESESGLNCYTSSSEHSVDTVIFCGKSNINHTNHTDLGPTNKLQYNVPTNTALNSIQVQTNAQKDEPKEEIRRKSNDSAKQFNETPVSSPNHRSNKEVKRSDELWVDGPKWSRRKKDQKQMKWSQELWVDGPNAQLESNVEHSICYYEEKQQRIQQWIQQHTKHIWSDIPSGLQTPPTQTCDSAYCSTVKQIRQKNISPEMLDASCQTEVTPSTSTVTPTDCELSFGDALRILSNDEIFGIERIAGAGREAMSECCDNEFCNNSCVEDMDDCHSEPITEPPKQLKLEQFLQHLTSLTMPRNYSCRESPSHKKDLEYRSLRHPDGASNQNLNISHWDLPKPEFNDFSTLSYLTAKESVKSPTATTSQPLSVSSPPQISTPNEPLFVTSSPNHAVLPTSPRVNRLLGTNITSSHSSPAKSSVSRKQQKIEQQLKRNTTSTTTSGHGTTSEGECSSVAKKTSSLSSPGCMSHHPVVQRQPASSGYESTIHDDDSDRELVGARRLEIGSTINESVGGTPVKIRSKKCEISKDDNKNRLSTSSTDQCSFLCCKFMKFYQ